MQTTEVLNKVKGRTHRCAPTLALLLFFCTGLHAQVTIGGLTDPAAGAILDLNSTAKGGLILSNVTITNPEKIPHNATVFQGIDDASDHNNTELRGTMVYNDGQNPALPAGVYIWNGSCWTKNGGEVIINTPAITVDGAVKSSVEFIEGGSVTLAVASPQPDVSYEWFQNTTDSNTGGTPTGTTGETYSTPDDLEIETYYYYCKATSLACPSVNAVFSGVITVTVKADLGNLPPLPIGSGNLGGLVCFDVAFSNSGGNCGDLASRQPGRSFSGLPEQVYTFTGSAAGLTFDFKNLSATPVIQSLSQSGTTVTVTFNTGLDESAKGLPRAQALKAELYAIQNNQATKLTLSVSDCQCCPGLLVPGGEYNQYSQNPTTSLPSGTTTSGQTNGGAAKALLDGSTKTGYDLCYYKRDADTDYSWNDASGSASGSYSSRGICGTTHGVDAVDAHDDWRLPNLAELAQIGQVVSSYTSAAINTGVGSQTHVNAAISQNTMGSDVIALPVGSNTTTGTYNLFHTAYWSSTEYNTSTYAWYWLFAPSIRYATTADKTSSTYVRCVRRF